MSPATPQYPENMAGRTAELLEAPRELSWLRWFPEAVCAVRDVSGSTSGGGSATSASAKVGGGMKLVSGFAFPDEDTFMALEIKADGSYQKPHLEAALPYVKDFACAIDGGAHVGTWSALLAKRFALVIAVEPAPDAFECLAQNMRPYQNVECRQVAVAHGSCSSAALALDAKQAKRGNTGGRYLSPDGVGSVQCQTIDSWNLKRLGFLKLDVEGYEPFALNGAAETLCRCKPIVLFEAKQFHVRYGLEPHAPETFLTSIGYRFLAAAGHDQIWGPA